jgi:hypothetical protein
MGRTRSTNFFSYQYITGGRESPVNLVYVHSRIQMHLSETGKPMRQGQKRYNHTNYSGVPWEENPIYGKGIESAGMFQR